MVILRWWSKKALPLKRVGRLPVCISFDNVAQYLIHCLPHSSESSSVAEGHRSHLMLGVEHVLEFQKDLFVSGTYTNTRGSTCDDLLFPSNPYLTR